MTDEQFTNGSTVSTSFNQNIEKRLVDLFYDKFKEAQDYATANELKQPKKGEFASYVVLHGLKGLTPIDYFKKKN